MIRRVLILALPLALLSCDLGAPVPGAEPPAMERVQARLDEVKDEVDLDDEGIRKRIQEIELSLDVASQTADEARRSYLIDKAHGALTRLVEEAETPGVEAMPHTEPRNLPADGEVDDGVEPEDLPVDEAETVEPSDPAYPKADDE